LGPSTTNAMMRTMMSWIGDTSGMASEYHGFGDRIRGRSYT
jgi:hypothetical protein